MKTTKTKLVATALEDVFVVWTNTDLTEGRGGEYPLCVCRLEATAKRRAKGNYVMGTDCSITKEKAYLIDNKWYMLGGIDNGNDEDIKVEKELAAERELKIKIDAAIAKAKEAGLNDADIELLKKATAKA